MTVHKNVKPRTQDLSFRTKVTAGAADQNIIYSKNYVWDEKLKREDFTFCVTFV